MSKGALCGGGGARWHASRRRVARAAAGRRAAHRHPLRRATVRARWPTHRFQRGEQRANCFADAGGGLGEQRAARADALVDGAGQFALAAVEVREGEAKVAQRLVAQLAVGGFGFRPTHERFAVSRRSVAPTPLLTALPRRGSRVRCRHRSTPAPASRWVRFFCLHSSQP